MRSNKSRLAPLAATALALGSGAASAHEGLHLLQHGHPHLGLEHLLAVLLLGGVVSWVVGILRRR